MKHRRLGKTGLEVSEIGFGAWGIGGELWQDSDDKESLEALHLAVELGINFFDTALAYGKGHSEKLLSQLLKEHKEKIHVATKIPPKNREWPARKESRLRDVFPLSYIKQCTEESIRNLRVDRLDLQQFHVWNDDWSDDNEWRDAVDELKEQGKIRFLGISINDHQPENALRAAQTGYIDTFQVIYNIFDQTPEDKLFRECQKRGIGVIVRVPFDEGALTGSVTPETEFPRSDFRRDYFAGDRKTQVAQRMSKLRMLLDGEAKSLPELALRFCLHHDAVSTVIPGMRKPKHVETNCSLSDGRRLGAELIAELRKHRWERNFYD
ncbi:MAG: aldo/keto reductase [Ignavibacteriales bacterium]|nr:aldo/keto reductase [Ignavibacteriales bacterium]